MTFGNEGEQEVMAKLTCRPPTVEWSYLAMVIMVMYIDHPFEHNGNTMMDDDGDITTFWPADR